MSNYNTQLQSNNTDLQGVLELLQTKAEGIIPSGTLTITENGTHDVTDYASAVVEIEGSGSGEAAEWSETEDAMVSRTISGAYTNDRITNIGPYAFTRCTRLTSVSFPVCTDIGSHAFQHCRSLTTANFPVCTRINYNTFQSCSSLTSVSFPVCTNICDYAFQDCFSLTTVSFPVCTSISSRAFHGCDSLTSANFPVCTRISDYAFYGCETLSQLYLAVLSVCRLVNSKVFLSTPYAGYSTYFSGTPYIYVPSSLLTSYQTATNWTYFSSYFSAIENAPDWDGTYGTPSDSGSGSGGNDP